MNNTELAKLLTPDQDMASTVLRTLSSLLENEKLSKVLKWSSVLTTLAVPAYQRYMDYLQKKDDYQFELIVGENDQLYDLILREITYTVPEEQQETVYLSTKVQHHTYEQVMYLDEGTAQVIDLQYDIPSRFQTVIGGVSVMVDKLDSRKVHNEDSPTSQRRAASEGFLPDRISISTRSDYERSSLINYLQEKISEQSTRQAQYYSARPWGSWKSSTAGVPIRKRSSVILKEGQMDEIFNIFQTFLQSEQEYTRLGIPYHMGVLFHGSPGTGKTSLATVISTELGLDVYALSLSSIEGDEALSSALIDIPPRSILLIEDVDVAQAAKSRDSASDGKVTLSGLLNALDGVLTPHGLITIMTTNYIKSLDPALIRAGRVDHQILIDEIDNYQLRMLCLEFIGSIPEDLPYVDSSDRIVAADILKVFKSNLWKPENNAKDLVTTIMDLKKKAAHI